jgi:hypothetical protein
MLLLHGWGLLWGTDSPGTVAATSQAYAVRHLGVTVLSLVGVTAAAALARLLLGSRGWALVCAAVLVAVPTWTGHAMFNVKDVPVATGYTLLTLGVVLVVRSTSTRWRTGLGALLALAGLVLAVGTRPGIGPGLAAAGAVGVGLCLLRRQWWRAGLLCAVALLAVGAVTALYPEAFRNPVAALVDGALESSQYADHPGRRWYLPLYLGVELPTLLLLLGAAGTVLAVLRVAGRRGASADDRVLLGLVLLQTFLLPVLAVAKASNLYTGIRQLLFAAPGLAVLVTLAVALLWASPRRSPRTRRLVPLLAAVAVGVPLVVQLQLFPYSYAFSSVPANLASPRLAAHDRDLEVQTDYWRTSVRELAPAVPAAGWVTCTPRIDDDERFLPRADESRRDCADDPIGPLAPYVARRGDRAAAAPSPEQFLAVDAGSAFVGRNCAALHRVTRHLWWRTVTMSSVSRCDLVLADYPADGARFDGAGRGADYLRGGWSLLRQDPGAGLGPGAEGLVSFRLPAATASGAVRVTGTGADLTGLRATANGDPVDVDAGADRFRLDVPAASVAAWGGGRLVLDLTAAPSGLRLFTLDLSPLGPSSADPSPLDPGAPR